MTTALVGYADAEAADEPVSHPDLRDALGACCAAGRLRPTTECEVVGARDPETVGVRAAEHSPATGFALSDVTPGGVVSWQSSAMPMGIMCRCMSRCSRNPGSEDPRACEGDEAHDGASDSELHNDGRAPRALAVWDFPASVIGDWLLA